MQKGISIGLSALVVLTTGMGCVQARPGPYEPMSDLEISASAGLRCMYLTGIMSSDSVKRWVKDQADAEPDSKLAQRLYQTSLAGVSKSDIERQEKYIKQTGGCKNVALAWIAAYLPPEKASKITAELMINGWFDKKFEL